MSEAESDRPRTAWVGPLLIAVVLLTVIGGVVGFVLGTGGEDPDVRQELGGGPGSSQSPTPGYEPTPTPTPTPYADTTSTAERPAPTTAAAGGHERPTTCPAHTERLAKQAGSPGGLSLTLYLRTEHSEVWICTDTDGVLFYQGHSGSPGEKLVEGDNALFLTTISRTGAGYVATNHTHDGTTRYEVTAKELVIRHSGGPPETQPAI